MTGPSSPPVQAAGPAPQPIPVLIEIALASLVFTSLGYVAWRLLMAGHLPPPFQPNPAVSLMDFYNTAYWAHRPGAYEIWHTVYPPLSFVFLRLFTTHECYSISAFIARDCDIRAMLPIIGFYFLNIILVYFSYRRLDPRTAIARSIAVCAGVHMLYGLESANLIIPCFTAFVLAEGGLVRSKWLRQLCLAVSINFKPYLLLAVLPQVARRRWGWLIGLGLTGVAIYLLTYALEGAGSPTDIIRDITYYARGMGPLYLDQNHLASLGVWNMIFPGLIYLGQAGVAACYGLAWFAPDRVCPRRFSALILTVISGEAILNTQGFSADYTEIFLLFIVLTERWQGSTQIIVIISAYMLSISADYTIVTTFNSVSQSYLGNRPVLSEYGISIGQFVRPSLLIIVQYGLINLALKDILGTDGSRIGYARLVRKFRILEPLAKSHDA